MNGTGAGLERGLSGNASRDGPQEKPMKDDADRSRRMDLFDCLEGVGCNIENAGDDAADDWKKAENAKAADSSPVGETSEGAERGAE